MVVVAAAVTWQQWHWWSSIIVIHPIVFLGAVAVMDVIITPIVQMLVMKKQNLKKKILPTAQEMLLSTSLGPFFSPIFCLTAYNLAAHCLLFVLTAYHYQVLLLKT